MAGSIFEVALLGSALLSCIYDTSGAFGAAYNFPLALFGLVALWNANPRGIMVFSAFTFITLILDIVFVAVWYRPTASVVFISIDMFVKAALFYLAYLELRKLGADYRSALSTPTSVSSGGSIAVTAGGESASSYQKFQSGAVSGAHMGGAAAESLDSDVYKSAAAGYNAPGAAADASAYGGSYQS